jgi:pilus assembly protein Flp/PilA
MLSGIQRLIVREDGQDLIEYALIVSLIAFAAVASLNTLADAINTVFVNIGTVLASAG